MIWACSMQEFQRKLQFHNNILTSRFFFCTYSRLYHNLCYARVTLWNYAVSCCISHWYPIVPYYSGLFDILCATNQFPSGIIIKPSCITYSEKGMHTVHSINSPVSVCVMNRNVDRRVCWTWRPWRTRMSWQGWRAAVWGWKDRWFTCRRLRTSFSSAHPGTVGLWLYLYTSNQRLCFTRSLVLLQF